MPWFKKQKLLLLLKFHKWQTITAEQQDSDYMVIMWVSQQGHSYYRAISHQHLEKLHFHWLPQSPPQVIYKYMILISIKKTTHNMLGLEDYLDNLDQPIW